MKVVAISNYYRGKGVYVEAGDVFEDSDPRYSANRCLPLDPDSAAEIEALTDPNKVVVVPDIIRGGTDMRPPGS